MTKTTKQANELYSGLHVNYEGGERIIHSVDRPPRRVEIVFMNGERILVPPTTMFEVIS